MNKLLLEARNLERRFKAPGKAPDVQALAGVDLQIKPGEFIVLRGPSGCGKSTLLLTLGSLRRPSAGSVHFEGQDMYGRGDRERRRLRSGPISFIFQEMHLLPYLDARSNVALALGQRPAGEALERASELLQELGLAERLAHRPAQLSAGERQRVAVARALIRQPKLILADEPTGSLDPDSEALVLERLERYQKAGGSVLLVTHAPHLESSLASRSLSMRAGRLDDA
jgi:putative ABC transport system ATP-binding protein